MIHKFWDWYWAHIKRGFGWRDGSFKGMLPSAWSVFIVMIILDILIIALAIFVGLTVIHTEALFEWIWGAL